MVFFTCDACGESLKKNAVEKHYQFQCRSCSVLSCVDCSKDFPGDSYKEHTSCISEAEKYSGKDFKLKANANKGEKKQTQWTEQVQSAIAKSKADSKLKGLLERLMDYPNIPRKKAKFQNFVKNSMGVWDATLCERTWNVIAAEMTPPTPANSEANKPAPEEKPQEEKQNGDASTNGDQNSDSEDIPAKKLNKKERKEERQKLQNKDGKKQKRKRSQEEEAEEVSVKKKKSKKRKHKESDEEENEEPVEPAKKSKNAKKAVSHVEEEEAEETAEEPAAFKFTWEGAIVGVLRKADDNELPLKKLRKKVLAQYYACGGDAKIKTEEEALAKFNKKVNKNPRLRTQKERVKLLH